MWAVVACETQGVIVGTARPGGAGQAKVGGDERCADLLGEDDVDPVRDRQVASALPGEREEWSHLGHAPARSKDCPCSGGDRK